MPQPIDLQSELGRLTAAERVQQITTRASLVAQQRLAADEQQQDVNIETQVQETHAKSGEVEPELRRRNPYLGRKRRREEPKAEARAEEERPAPPVAIETHQLDVTV